MVLIKELLNKFDLNIKLSEKLLNIKVEGSYNKVSKDKLRFHSNNGFAYFNCFVLKGVDYILMIAPNNNIETIVFRKKIEDRYIGYSYNHKGEQSFIV